MQSGRIKVDGIHTLQDANKVCDALHSVWGVLSAEVNVNSHEATFSYDEKAACQQDFEAVVIDSGFGVGK